MLLDNYNGISKTRREILCSKDIYLPLQNHSSHGFRYRKSFKTVGKGCRFDSLTELKDAIPIRDKYFFLRKGVTIYYNP